MNETVRIREAELYCAGCARFGREKFIRMLMFRAYHRFPGYSDEVRFVSEFDILLDDFDRDFPDNEMPSYQGR